PAPPADRISGAAEAPQPAPPTAAVGTAAARAAGSARGPVPDRHGCADRLRRALERPAERGAGGQSLCAGRGSLAGRLPPLGPLRQGQSARGRLPLRRGALV